MAFFFRYRATFFNVKDTAKILAFRNVKDLSPDAKKQVEEFIRYIRYKEFTNEINEINEKGE